MNAFIKEAISEKLVMLNEEKEALDSSIISYQEKLVIMIKTQAEYEKTIKETLAFLKENNKNVTTARPQAGQERSRAFKGSNSGAVQRKSPTK